MKKRRKRGREEERKSGKRRREKDESGFRGQELDSRRGEPQCLRVRPL